MEKEIKQQDEDIEMSESNEDIGIIEEGNKNKKIIKEFSKDIRTRTDNKYSNKIDNEDNAETQNENGENEKLEKIKKPKRKYAIVHGYLGHNYCGNQK